MVDSHAARLETSPLNHMRGPAKLHTDEAGVEYVPKSLTSALEFDKVFSRLAPLEIDLGCGDGAFLPSGTGKSGAQFSRDRTAAGKECGVLPQLRGWI